ncbi:MAG: hypothetical protein KAR14_13670, partial [Candidatus Aminicenantes bacterium]|nr:hypothetical protein [Candidatus Aminicenantes bacterium]
LGLLLGGSGLKILDADTIRKFQPFLIFGLAWVGYLYGIQFEIKLVMALPKKFFSITAIQAIITFIIVSLSMFTFFHLLSIISLEKAIIISIVLGITALSTAQSALAIANRNFKFKDQRLFDLLRYIAAVDGLFSMFFFSVFLAFTNPGTATIVPLLSALKWTGLTAFAALIPAMIFLLMNKTGYKHGDFLLLLTGIIAFTGGMSWQLGLSPLISGLIAGIFIANTCKFRIRALNFLSDGEKPIYIIMLIILGAGWDLGQKMSIAAVLIFIIFRTAGKVTGNFAAVKSFRSAFRIPPGVGFSLLSQGGISFGIIINFNIIYPELSTWIIYIILISTFFFELISPRLILASFQDRANQTSGPLSGEYDEK